MSSRRAFDLAKFEDLAGEWRGRTHYFPAIGSTNQEARQILRKSPAQPQELILVADEQTAGRGRLGRSWQAPPASGLLCTLVFSLSPLTLDRAFLYTAAVALAVVRAAEELQPGSGVGLKWPNDVLRQGKKVGGILTELENGLGPNQNETWLALGFGLNISLSEGDYAEAGLSTKATNLTPEPVERELLLSLILGHFDSLRALLKHDPAKIREEWARALLTIGREVQVWNSTGEVQLTGLATGVAEDGALIIQEKGGRERRVQAGDVSVRMPDGSYSA